MPAATLKVYSLFLNDTVCSSGNNLKKKLGLEVGGVSILSMRLTFEQDPFFLCITCAQQVKAH